LEQKLSQYSELLSQMQDKDLKSLLEFVFFYVVEKPDAAPWNKTIAKHFEITSENKKLRDDIRRFLYAIRLTKSIAIDKQLIDSMQIAEKVVTDEPIKKNGILIPSRGVWLRRNKGKTQS
ncbi:MAG: hypothetical protein JSV58_03150, partial [Candidatus Bathyarchaeota archaeon]